MSEPFWTPLGGQPVDYKGAWAAGTQYAPGDVANYNGVDFLAVNPSLGVTPPTPGVLPVTKGVGFPLDRVGLLDPPDSRSDEFTLGTTLDPKWSLVGTTPGGGTVVAAPNGAPEGLWIQRTDASQAQLTAYLQAVSAPCTLYAKLGVSTLDGTNCRRGGIIFTPAAPTTASPAVYFGSFCSTAGARSCQGIRYSSFSAFSANYASIAFPSNSIPLWMRVELLAGMASYTAYASVDGHMWHLLEAARAVGFTIGAAGLGFSMEGQASEARVTFDYFRVTP